MRGDEHRMRGRKVRGAGAELDGLRLAEHRGEENEAVGDVLLGIGEMLANKGVVETQAIGEDDRLAILLQRDRRIARSRMQRHGEEAKSHKWGQINISFATPFAF